jgi:hypothetical protein
MDWKIKYVTQPDLVQIRILCWIPFLFLIQSVIESTTIQINRTISDHDLTYIVVNCEYHNDTSFKRNVWLYNKGNYDLFKQRVGDTDWGGIINNQTDMDISCNLFAKKFMQITHECIPTNCVTIRPNDKIWMTFEIRKEIRIRDRLRKKYIKNKIGTNERKYKNQRNKVNNLKKLAKENFYVSINESLSELKNTNCKQYWKTIKMLIKGEGPSSEYHPLRSPNQNDASAFDNSDKCNLLNDYVCSITDLQDEYIPLPDFDDRGPNTLTDITVVEQDIIDIISLLIGPDVLVTRCLGK